jgi:hypothetical protein
MIALPRKASRWLRRSAGYAWRAVRSDPGSAQSMGCFTSLLTLLIGLLTCGAGFYIVLDGQCKSSAGLWLEDYPGSTVVGESHSFLRPFGIGETTRILYVTDAPSRVRGWYLERDGLRFRARHTRPSAANHRLEWSVTQADDRVGSVITLYSVCLP